jgi:hypothetical protein
MQTWLGHVQRDLLEAVLVGHLVDEGTRKFRPGASVAWYLPSRSTTQAFCWGTTLTERMMKMAAMTKSRNAISMLRIPG